MPVVADLERGDWHRLNRLLEDALALDETARSDWLKGLPAADADLAPLLAKLLAATDRTETADFVAKPPLPAEEQAGQRIGPYRLLAPLGAGGMGTVWRAERADGAFERQVALKLPHAEWTDRGLAQRFARERAALASLNHPHIAQLFDAGWSETGRPYLALEYVDGQPILAWCETHHLDTAARLRLFVTVVRAVAHAHAHLVVHRDLKPSNVLVTAEGQVKLLDFGIAKLLGTDSSSAEETELTRLGGRVLTPSYAAPEQILGQPITTAVDIYALGVMLFELLTGERPYRLGRADVQSRSALEEAIVRVDAMAPSAVVKDPTLRRALRGDLDAIVLKALKKRPEERYPTAAEFADDLERHLEHRPVRAQRDSRAYRLRRLVVRNRYAVGAVSAVMLALVIGLAATLWQAREARQEAEHANTIKHFVLSVIQEADPQASQRTREADMTLLDATRDRVAKELASRPDLQLEVRLAIATAYRNRGAWEPARQTLRAAVDDARGKVSDDNLDLLTARVRLAEWPIVDGASALEELDAIVAAARRLGKPAVPLLIEALLARKTLKAVLSIGYTGDDPTAQARAEAQEILALAEETYPSEHPKRFEATISMVSALAGAGKRKEALSMIEPAWRRARATPQLGPGHPLKLRVQAWYANLLCQTGRCEVGLKMLRENVDLARTHHGPNSRVLGDALMSLSRGIFYVFRDYKELIALRREAYRIAAATEPMGSLRRASIAETLAITLLGVWRPDEMWPLLEEVRGGNKNLPNGPMRSRATWMLLHLEGVTLAYSGETKKAIARYAEFGRQAETEGDSLWQAQARFDTGIALRLEGDFQTSEPIAEESVRQSRLRPEVDHFELRYELGELGAAKLGVGKYQEALAALDESQSNRSEVTGHPEPFFPYDALHDLRRGQALLHLHRRFEARGQFERVVHFWRDFDPDHPMAAEAAWWYGHSLIATGEVKRGTAMVAEARPRLAASFLPHLRPLATTPAPITLAANSIANGKSQAAAR
jgi:serine/threonine-protein kinase